MYRLLLLLSFILIAPSVSAKLTIDASSGWHLHVRDQYEQGTVQVSYNCHAIYSYDRLVENVRFYGSNFSKFSFEESIARYRDTASFDDFMNSKYVSLYDYDDKFKGKIDLVPIQNLIKSESLEIERCKNKYHSQMAEIEQRELLEKLGIAASVIGGLIAIFFAIKFFVRKFKVAKEKSKRALVVASNSMKHRKEKEVIKNAALDEATRISVREAAKKKDS
ncbi:hypothetical protein [Shewanella sp. ENK2]|uniref:hypothetical protein n=1 Tax=Shewanella sp. ENK2 TaxID=2775245 RepID=UPI00374A0A9D